RHDARACSTRHCRSDRDKLGIDGRKLCQPLSKNRGVARIRGRRLYLLAGCGIMTRGERVPLLDVLAGRKSLPLLGDDVNEARAFHGAHRCERFEKKVDIVTVDRTEVAKAELLEQNAGREEG